jgi:hypothetical protein
VRKIIKASGGELPVVKIRDGLTESEAFDYEVLFIAAIGRVAHGGPLVNFSDGGEGGATGAIRSAETREKIRAALKDKPKSPEHRAALRVPHKPLTEEYRAEISRRQIGKRHSAERCAAISRGNLNSPKNATRYKASGDAQRGIPRGPCTPERREKSRLGMLAYHARRRAEGGI